jgi:hypothetical protein
LQKAGQENAFSLLSKKNIVKRRSLQEHKSKHIPSDETDALGVGGEVEVVNVLKCWRLCVESKEVFSSLLGEVFFL